MLQIVAVYRRQGKLTMSALSKTVAGFWIQAGPFLSVPENAGEEEVVHALMTALEGSKSGVDGPTDWKEFQKRFLKSVGVKSMRDLHVDTTSCGVEKEGNQLKFTPSQNLGPKEGFAPLPSVPDLLADATNPHEVYARLKEILDKCK
jgi:hypothetical protein